MAQQFRWTADRHQVLGNLVRRHAFDFGAATQAFQEYLRDGGVDFTVEEVNAKCLRKVFAGLDRKRAASSPAPAPASANPHRRNIRPTVPAQLAQSLTNGDDSQHLLDVNKPEVEFVKDLVLASSTTKLLNPMETSEATIRNHAVDSPTVNTTSHHEIKKRVDEGVNMTELMSSVKLDEKESDTANWTFDAFVREQEEQEQQHEAQKERMFRNVLTALGGPAKGRVIATNELPPDVLRAWETRSDEIILAKAKAREDNRKNEEDRELALQRERLKNRNIPGGEDSVGDDPLAESTEAQQSTELPVGPADTAFLSPGDSFKPSSARGVTLELGMGAKELDLLLSELEEESVVTTGGVGTNSELSQVLDILDEAAGDARPVHPTPSRVENGSAADDTSAGRSVAPPS